MVNRDMAYEASTQPAGLIADLRGEARWLSSGFLLTFCSCFGQTYFIAIFAGHLRSALNLSDGEFGSLYTLGTLASAALLTYAGKWPDRFPIRWLGAAILAGLAAAALGMALVSSAAMLALVFFALRFFGQGMATHTAMTAMGRWYSRKRGRAVSIAALGFSVSEGLMPLVAVAVTALVGWRMAWVTFAAFLLAIPIPLLITLLKRKRIPSAEPASHETQSGTARRHWTRGQVLTHSLFYALLPGVLAPPFIVTGLFFNQVTIVALKGWELSWFAASFPLFAGTTVVAGLGAGWLIDRVGARHLLPLYLLPMGLGTALLAYIGSPLVLPVFMALIGLTAGSGSTLQGALWAELYGTEHLGAIRAVAMSAIVFASALSPGLIGVLLDAGVPLQMQMLAMALYSFAAAGWMALWMGRFHGHASA